jgi:hypothetical protein
MKDTSKRVIRDGKGNFITRSRLRTKIRAVRAGRTQPVAQPPDSYGLFGDEPPPRADFGERKAGILEIARSQQHRKPRTDK